MADQEPPTSKGIGTSKPRENQNTSQSNANVNQGTSTSNTDGSPDTSQLKGKVDQNTSNPNTDGNQDTSPSKEKAGQDSSNPNTDGNQDTSHRKADQDTSTPYTDDSQDTITPNTDGSQDTSPPNTDSRQHTFQPKEKADHDTSTLNTDGRKDTTTPNTYDSQDTSQSNTKMDQDNSTPNIDDSQDTSQSNTKANQDSSTSNNIKNQGTSAVIDTTLSLWSSTLFICTVLYRDALSVVLSKEGFFSLAAFLIGCEASHSKQAFCLVLFSFLGGSEYGQRVPILTLLYFIGGFWVGVGDATVYVLLLFCFIAYACELNTRDAVIVGFTFLFGLLCNVSDQAFFLVVYSYLGGQIVRCDKEALIYLGPSFLIGSTGAFDLLSIPFSMRF